MSDAPSPFKGKVPAKLPRGYGGPEQSAPATPWEHLNDVGNVLMVLAVIELVAGGVAALLLALTANQQETSYFSAIAVGISGFITAAVFYALALGLYGLSRIEQRMLTDAERAGKSV